MSLTFLRTWYQMSWISRLRRRFLQIDKDGRLSGLRVALDVVEVRRLLELLFDPVRHLLEGVDSGGARPGDLNHHGLHGEVGILLTTKPLIGPDAADDAEQHQEDDEGLVVDCPFGKIEARHHSTSVSGFTRLAFGERIDAGGDDFLSG